MTGVNLEVAVLREKDSCARSHLHVESLKRVKRMQAKSRREVARGRGQGHGEGLVEAKLDSRRMDALWRSDVQPREHRGQ